MNLIDSTSFGDGDNQTSYLKGFDGGLDFKINRYDIDTCKKIFERAKKAEIPKISYNPNKPMKDFVKTTADPFYIVTKRVYDYFNDNNLSSNLLFKKIELYVQYKNIKVDGDYYLMLPKEVIQIEKFSNGISYTTYPFNINNDIDLFLQNMYKRNNIPFDKELFDLKLCISDDLVKSFKKQKFTGACIEELKKEDDKLEYCITYFENNYKNEKELIKAWFEHLSNSKIVKSKCKYIFYTFIEEEKGYSLS